MERLTKSNLNKVCYDPWELCGMDQYCSRGIHDEGGCTKGCHILKMYKKLAEYEDAEEQKKKRDNKGKLNTRRLVEKVTLPVIGEMYVACVEDASMESMQALQDPLKKLYEYEQEEENGMLVHFPCKLGDIPYALLTREDAEQKLKEMEYDYEN